MMDPYALLDFQINRLGYNFKNVDLLTEAVTHSLDPQDHVTGFPDQNRTFRRLQVIGNAVLKFTSSHYVVLTSDLEADEGVLTTRKESLIHGDIQMTVGRRLVEGGALTRFVRVSRSMKDRPGSTSNVTFNEYDKLVRAILGAVFMDAGGISGEGVAAAFAVFLKIWGTNLDERSDSCGESIQARFPPPSETIQRVWEQKGVDNRFLLEVERCLGAGHKFRKQHLLGEALIHPSFYEGISWKNLQDIQHRPHYQRLEFLGDSVLELVVAEMIWRAHPPDSPTGPMSERIRLYIQAFTQIEICKTLGLEKHVKVKAGGLAGWKGYDDVVESLVGALFVDGGGSAVKEFVAKVWRLPEYMQNFDESDLESKLGYKFKNPTFLRRALTLPWRGNSNVTKYSEISTEETRLLRDVLVYFGKSWIEFHATEVILRSCDPKNLAGLLLRRRNELCSEAVFHKIGSYLNLEKICLSREELGRGEDPNTFYRNVVEALAGAIFKDMQEASIKMSFDKVFYRLWNPFLKTRPPSFLLIHNLPLTLERVLTSVEVEDIQERMRYTFRNRAVLEKTLNSSSLSCFKAKYAMIGESAMDLAISVFVAILIHMNIANGEQARANSIDALHSSTLITCLAKAKELFGADSLHEYCTDRVSTEELVKRALGAVYVDMSEDKTDAAFSQWKEYFILTCEFITGK